MDTELKERIIAYTGEGVGVTETDYPHVSSPEKSPMTSVERWTIGGMLVLGGYYFLDLGVKLVLGHD